MIVVRRVAVVLLAVFLLSPQAHAWGPDGHRIVAEIAQRHLDPAAEAQVARLLAGHAGRLAEVASWADEIQDDPSQQALWKATRSLHYINFRGPDCAYQPPRDCREGRCVVAGLAHYVGVLGDRSQSVQARREALEFVVHFVGDVHQPLHAGYRPDKGGNTYQVQFQGKGSNLHRVWDSGMLRTRGLGWQDYAQRLDAGTAAGLPMLADAPFAAWAEESCRLSRDVYPSGHAIDASYVQAELPLAERRLRQAGLRLAALLNRTLG